MPQITLTSTDTLPLSRTVTGTVTANTTNKIVTGTGTAFLADIGGGDYLYDATNDQLRKVNYVNSDTELILYAPFTVALTGATVKTTKGNARQISVAASGGDIVIVDSYGNTSAIKDGSSLTPEPLGLRGVEPFIVKATSAATAYTTITN